MLAGSLLLHVLALMVLWWTRPEPPPPEPDGASNELAMVFESPGAKEASTKSENASQTASAPQGNVNATTVQPLPDTSPPAPQPPPSPPAAPQSSPPPPEATPPTPQPAPQPPVEATQAPIEQPPPLPAMQDAPRPPAKVTLSQEDEPLLPPPPRFVMPQAPPPLAPLPPRAAPPRPFARATPQNPFAAPQDWSLNTVPSQRQPGRPSRGIDLSTGDLAGQKEATVGWVSGAKPSGSWIGALKAWVQARTYYPEQALAEQQQGPVTLQLVFDRSGKVLSSVLVRSSGSPFLNQGFLGEFRNATAPAFTADMTDPTTTVIFTMNYVLVGRRR